MRTHWLPLILLLAAPRPATANTALIPLHHLPATKVERQLLLGESQPLGSRGWLAGQEQGLVPAGITAWTVDERRNAFEVVGSEQGIQSFRQIIQLLDVPARQVRLSVRVVPLADGGLPGLRLEPLPPVAPGQPPTDYVALATRDQVAALQPQAAFSTSEMSVTSSHSLHLHSGEGQDQLVSTRTILPRVNRDGSVTLFISRLGRLRVDQDGTIVLRRVARGQAAIVQTRKTGRALVVEVREIVPTGAGG